MPFHLIHGDITKLAVNAIVNAAKKCGEEIESTYTHDFRSCKCGACAVDSGYDYFRRCGDPKDWEELSGWTPEDFEKK